MMLLLTRRIATLLATLAGLAALGGSCGAGGGANPSVSVTLNAVDDDLKDLLVVATDATLPVNVTFTAGNNPIDPDTFSVDAYRWGGGSPVTATTLSMDATGALVTWSPFALPMGTYTVLALVQDTAGAAGFATLSFAVRDRPGAMPIGTGQAVWYDFTSDRDAVPGPDFPVDLQLFGLGSPLDPALSAQVEADVISAILDRLSETYHDENPNGFASPDPVEISFFSSDPGTTPVTRICVGGSSPSGGSSIGGILIDLNNANRGGVECGTIPPTGIFPQGMMAYAGQTEFQQAFDPLMISRGGTPVGEHTLDPIVLAAGFDPGSAPPDQIARYNDITTAVQRFGDSLGSVIAHETGHALGLVAPAKPGVGFHGGQLGAEFSHDVTSDGTTPPAANYLMKQGATFDFAKLAGLSGHVLPFFRPLDYAYLRDRLMLDSQVTQLLMPPVLTGVSPTTIGVTTVISATGSAFAATPSLRLVQGINSWEALGEAWVSDTLVMGTVVGIMVPSGVYDLEIENPDGQKDVLPNALTVAP